MSRTFFRGFGCCCIGVLVAALVCITGCSTQSRPRETTAWVLKQNKLPPINKALKTLQEDALSENAIIAREAADGIISIHQRLLRGWPALVRSRGSQALVLDQDILDEIDTPLMQTLAFLATHADRHGELKKAFYLLQPLATQTKLASEWERLRVEAHLPLPVPVSRPVD